MKKVLFYLTTILIIVALSALPTGAKDKKEDERVAARVEKLEKYIVAFVEATNENVDELSRRTLELQQHVIALEQNNVVGPIAPEVKGGQLAKR